MRALAILAMCAATTSAAAEPKPVALLTSVGSAKEVAGKDVDRALRQALDDDDDVDLLAPGDTREHVNSLAEMGLICLPEDVECLAKLGTTASVAFVMVPVVDKAENGRVAVAVSVIDVGKTKLARLVKAELSPADASAIRALARRALGREDAPPDKPPPDKPPPDKPPPDKPPPDKPPPEAGPPVGLIVAGVGGAMAGLAVAGAVVCDLIYADILDVADAKTRRDVIQPAGAAPWIAGGVGLVVLGSGVALLLTENPAE